jgi:hypothetical protein
MECCGTALKQVSIKPMREHRRPRGTVDAVELADAERLFLQALILRADAQVHPAELRQVEILRNRLRSVTRLRPANHHTSARFRADRSRRGRSFARSIVRLRDPLCDMKILARRKIG